jgi:hypothetical protein
MRPGRMAAWWDMVCTSDTQRSRRCERSTRREGIGCPHR